MIKLRQPPSLEVEEMLIQYNISTKPERWGMLAQPSQTNVQSKWRVERIRSTSPPGFAALR